MSIATMVALGVERQLEHSQPRTRSFTPNASKKPVDSALEKISAFIPSEVIGIYVAGFGILSPDTSTEKWWIFGVCLALIPLAMALSYLEQKKRKGVTLSLSTSLVLLVLAVIAFAAWAAALPGTPFLSLTPKATAYGGFAVVILAAFLYKVADLLGVVPKTQS